MSAGSCESPAAGSEIFVKEELAGLSACHSLKCFNCLSKRLTRAVDWQRSQCNFEISATDIKRNIKVLRKNRNRDSCYQKSCLSTDMRRHSQAFRCEQRGTAAHRHSQGTSALLPLNRTKFCGGASGRLPCILSDCTAAIQNAFSWLEIDWILQLLLIFTLRFDGCCQEYSQVPIPEFEKRIIS